MGLVANVIIRAGVQKIKKQCIYFIFKGGDHIYKIRTIYLIRGEFGIGLT